MKQLTYAEKQQLEVKIDEERERQRARRMNPNTPGTSPKTDHLHKYGMLALIFCLLVFAVVHLLKYRDFAYDKYANLIVALMLLFNHIAYNFIKTGWKNRVMRTVAWTWMVLGFVYILWGIRVGVLFA